MSGPACGIIASKYASAAGFKPPPGGAVASNWHKFGEKMNPEDINSPDHPFGSMFGTYNHRRYGGNVGAPLPTGATGGHVMSIVPGTYDPKTGKVDVVDQYGYSHGKRNISDMDLRFAGADAVAAAAARRGGQAPGAGTTPPSGAGGEGANAIARERANVMAQLKDPSTRALVASVIEHEQSVMAARGMFSSRSLIGRLRPGSPCNNSSTAAFTGRSIAASSGGNPRSN